MSKRAAYKQISSQNPGDYDDDVEEPEVSKASSDVMAKRKILKPRGHGGSGAGNPFKSVQPTGNAFSFGKTPDSSEKTNAFQFQDSKSSDEDDNNKIRALNEKFIATLTKANVPNTIADFRETAKKYIEYYNQIQKGEIKLNDTSSKAPISNAAPTSLPTKNVFDFTSKPTPSNEKPVEFANGIKPTAVSKPQAQSKPEQDPSSDSDSDSDEDIKIEGPKFTLASKPTVKNSPFSFGPKPVKKPSSDSDSDSEIEIKGPTFTFNKEIKDKVFKLTPASNTATKHEADKTNLSFGAVPAPSKPFNFGSSSNADAKEGSKPVFSFGGSAASKPAFTSESQQNSAEDKKDVAKPSLFGTATSSSAKPFSFGTSNTSSENTQSKPLFGSNNNASLPTSNESSKPSFSFDFTKKEGTKPDSTNPAPKPFTFGAPEKNDAPKPFSFGKPEAKVESAPQKFTFGSTEPKKDASNLFSLSSTETKNETPKPFSFGAPADASKAASGAFSGFGANTGGLFGAKPSGNLFGASNNGGLFGSNGTSDKNDANDEEKVPEEETGGEFKPVAQLASEKIESPNTGEEGEEVLYSKKAKLMLFDAENKESPYVNKGLGDLKLLKNKENNKTRILIRAEGGLRILLNAAVSKDFTYTTIGNGSMVRFPTIKPEDKKLETFVIKVKTAGDGEELLKKINDAK